MQDHSMQPLNYRRCELFSFLCIDNSTFPFFATLFCSGEIIPERYTERQNQLIRFCFRPFSQSVDVASETGRIDVTKGIVEKNHCHLLVNVPLYVSRLYDPRFCLLLVTFSRFCCSLVSSVSSNWQAAIFRPDLQVRIGRLSAIVH